MSFTTDEPGTITGVRFYKASANTGAHVGGLYGANGTLLASASFSGETASGWQQVSFSAPVSVSPNTTYVVAYFAPVGHYAADAYYWFTPSPTGGNSLNSSPLHALPAGINTNNGWFSYSSGLTFPTNTFQDSNYCVDPVFMPSSGVPGPPTNVTATAGNATATVSWSAPQSGGAPTSYVVTPYIGATAQTPINVNGSPPATQVTITGLTNGTTYTFTVTAKNTNGSSAPSTPSNAVTPEQLAAGGADRRQRAAGLQRGGRGLDRAGEHRWKRHHLLHRHPVRGDHGRDSGDGDRAQHVDDCGRPDRRHRLHLQGDRDQRQRHRSGLSGLDRGDARGHRLRLRHAIHDRLRRSVSTELGVKFTPSVSGTVTGVRFYKATTNVGTHVGSLWSTTGTLLASGTFSNETASGWQTLTFATPVTVTAGATYVAAYLAPSGHYSYTAQGFGTGGVTNGPLTAVANGTSANGVFTYSGASTFPSSTFNAANYWVDVELPARFRRRWWRRNPCGAQRRRRGPRVERGAGLVDGPAAVRSRRTP